MVNLERVSIADELNNQYIKLSKIQKKELVEVVSSFDVPLTHQGCFFHLN